MYKYTLSALNLLLDGEQTTEQKTATIYTFSEYFMCPSRKHKPHSRSQQGFKGKGREVQKVKAADEIDDKKWLRSNHPPLHRWRSHSFIIECRVTKICFLFHRRRTASLKAKQTLNTFSLCALSFIIYSPSCHSKPS